MQGPAIIIGDLNVQVSARLFRRTFAEPWHRAVHGDMTFFGYVNSRAAALPYLQ